MMMNLAFHSLLNYMRSTDQDTTPLLAKVTDYTGLSYEDITDWAEQPAPTVILTTPLIIELFNDAAELTQNDCIGIDASRYSSFAGFEGFGVALLSCASVSEAIDLFIKFKPLLANVVEVRKERDDNMQFSARITPEYGDPAHVLDFLLSVLVRIGRRITQNINLAPYHLQFERAAPVTCPDRFYEFYRCNVSFQCRGNVFSLTPQFIHCVPELSNPEMSSIGLQWCKQKEQEMAAKLEVKLGHLIETQLADASFSIEHAAKILNMSTRKLQKELQQLGLSYRSLHDRIRREKSIQLLQHSRKSISEISDETGYANETGFIRAFKRWEGTTPASYRRREG